MVEINNVEVVGWEHAIIGMRNPMNSWDKSDSRFYEYYSNEADKAIGKNDLELMCKLANAGTDHRKFMRMITVYCDINAPMYWWKEFDTYKVGTVRNSCSTMHKIHSKEFTLDDFSVENLDGEWLSTLDILLGDLEKARTKYVETKDKKYWWQIIQLLPSSYNQKATVMLNYEVLSNMYKSRKTHKLDEWIDFCKWIERLPHSELITG